MMENISFPFYKPLFGRLQTAFGFVLFEKHMHSGFRE